jgi:hypothetical protein
MSFELEATNLRGFGAGIEGSALLEEIIYESSVAGKSVTGVGNSVWGWRRSTRPLFFGGAVPSGSALASRFFAAIANSSRSFFLTRKNHDLIHLEVLRGI